MATRTDLDELHALAAVIAEDATDYRARRRQQTDELIRLRTQAAMAAPVKRRRRHRTLAFAIVGVVAACLLASFVVVARSHRLHPVVPKPQVSAGPGSAVGTAGRRAAHELGATGRSHDQFACLQKATAATRSVASTALASVRAQYLAACMGAG